MKFLGTLLLFGGYILIYAAVARGGRFATEPWMGLLSDAYETAPVGTGSSLPVPTGPTSTPTRPRTSPVNNPTYNIPSLGGIGHRNTP